MYIKSILFKNVIPEHCNWNASKGFTIEYNVMLENESIALMMLLLYWKM